MKVREDERTPVDLCHTCFNDLAQYPQRNELQGSRNHPKVLAAIEGPFAAGRASPRDGAPLSRLDLHYAPKHGSWLNMAEIELAVLTGQCLDRRLADQATLLEREVAAGQAAPSASGRGVDRRFTTTDARIKLKHLYPAIQD